MVNEVNRVNSKASLNNIFSSLADPTRRMILYQLVLGKKLNVTEIAKPHHMSLPAISKHLKVLENAHLIKRKRSGKKSFFTLSPSSLKSASDYLAKYIT